MAYEMHDCPCEFKLIILLVQEDIEYCMHLLMKATCEYSMLKILMLSNLLVCVFDQVRFCAVHENGREGEQGHH